MFIGQSLRPGYVQSKYIHTKGTLLHFAWITSLNSYYTLKEDAFLKGHKHLKSSLSY